MTGPSRRAALAGGLAAVLTAPALAPARLLADGTAERRFQVLRGRDDIGTKTVRVRGEGDSAEVEIEIALAVKILGITAYRYELSSREVWEDGRLVSLDSETNDDGDPYTARVRRRGDALVSDGTWKGEIPGDAGTTTYWSKAFLSRPVWISTQSGQPLDVTVARDGEERIPGPSGDLLCERWQVTGDLPVTLFYDTRGEWMGNAFDASGTLARFRTVTETGRLGPLWPERA